MDRVHQGIGSGSYLDADRVDRLVDQIVRTLNGGLYASALAPGFKVPNSYMKENGSVFLMRMRGTLQLCGLLPALAHVLAYSILNTSNAKQAISQLLINVGGTAHYVTAAEIVPAGTWLSTVDGPNAAAAATVNVAYGSGDASVLPALLVLALEHVA